MTTYTRNTLSGSLAPVNNELEKIEVSLREKLDRNPSVAQNNEMLDDLDMNSNRIINYPDAVNDSDLITKGQVASLAPVQTVNGQTGNVSIPTQIQIDNGVVFDNIAEMKSSSLEIGQLVKCKRYYALGDLVEGLEFEVQATQAVDGYIDHVLANGNVAILSSSSSLNSLQCGARSANTESQNNSALQAGIDYSKGKKFVVADDGGNGYLHSGLSLNGTTYNNTTIVCEGLLLLAPDGGGSTFGGAWVGLLIKDCDGVNLTYRGNGNQSAMTDREQIFCVGLAGATNLAIDTFKVENVQGDGMYISQSDWQSESAFTENVVINQFYGKNATASGRNGLSIISAKGVYIDNFVSINIGGFVNGVNQPAGLDIEPNFGYQICSDIYVGSGYVTSAGTSGVAVLGKAITDDATRDWNCYNIDLTLTNVRQGGTGSTLASAGILKCKNIKLNITERYVGTAGKGRIFAYCENVSGNLKLSNVTVGASLGEVDQVDNVNITVDVDTYTLAGIQTGLVNNSAIKGKINNATGGTCFALECKSFGRGTLTQTDVTYSIDAPSDGAARGVRNAPTDAVSFVRCIVQDCNLSGYTTPNDAQIKFSNVTGITNATTIPTTGAWVRGQIVYNDNVAITGASNVQEGWVRLTNNTTNITGTDWTFRYIKTTDV